MRTIIPIRKSFLILSNSDMKYVRSLSVSRGQFNYAPFTIFLPIQKILLLLKIIKNLISSPAFKNSGEGLCKHTTQREQGCDNGNCNQQIHFIIGCHVMGRSVLVAPN